MKGSSVLVRWVLVKQGLRGFSQYKLFDRMLRHHANTTLNQIYQVFITLVNITKQSIYLFPRQWSMLGIIYPIVFFFFFLLLLFLKFFFRVVLVTFNNKYFHAILPEKFLVQVKVAFFFMLFAL